MTKPKSKDCWHRQPKTINIRHSLVVTHPSTTRTFRSLYMGDRTGTLIFCGLWSIAEERIGIYPYIDRHPPQPDQPQPAQTKPPFILASLSIQTCGDTSMPTTSKCAWHELLAEPRGDTQPISYIESTVFVTTRGQRQRHTLCVIFCIVTTGDFLACPDNVGTEITMNDPASRVSERSKSRVACPSPNHFHRIINHLKIHILQANVGVVQPCLTHIDSPYPAAVDLG